MIATDRSTVTRVIPAAAAVAALALLTAATPRDPAHAAVERVAADLRTGQYEKARKGVAALGRRGGARAALLAARAERQLGLLREARGRLEEATVQWPEDLPVRAELMRVAEALGDRGAIQTLVD